MAKKSSKKSKGSESKKSSKSRAKKECPPNGDAKLSLSRKDNGGPPRSLDRGPMRGLPPITAGGNGPIDPMGPVDGPLMARGPMRMGPGAPIGGSPGFNPFRGGPGMGPIGGPRVARGPMGPGGPRRPVVG